MASLKNLFKAEKKDVIKVSVLDESTRDGINKAYIPKFLYKPPYGYPRMANLGYVRYLAQTPYVEMCVKTIINEIASIEWDIVPNDGMEEQSDDAEIEDIRNFFENPNTNKETFEQVFIKMPVRDLLEINSGIINKVYNLKEELVEVVARDGATFTKNPDVHGMYTNRENIILTTKIIDNSRDEVVNHYTDMTQTNAREKSAYFQYGWIAGPVPIPFGKKEIIWLEDMKRTDDHYGFSPVQTLAKNLQMLIYMVESDLDYYNDNNVPKGIIGLTDGDAEEIDAFKEQWTDAQYKKDDFGNMKKMMHKVPIVNSTPVFTRIEFSSSELQVIEKQKWYTKMVWACFGVTGVELGYTEDAAGAANQIVQSKVFRKKGINPILRNLESAYNINIISEFNYWGTVKTNAGKEIKRPKYKFVFKKFDVDEEKSKYELYKLQTEAGLKTVNEVRKDEGLEDVDWGDKPPNEFLQSENSFNMGGNNDSYGDDYGDREESAINPDEDAQEDVEDKSLKKKDFSEEKALSNESNPLILRENERPTGYTKFEQVMNYFLKKTKKTIEDVIKQENGKNTLAQIKDMSQVIDKIKSFFTIDGVKAMVYAIIQNNYIDGLEDAEKHLDKNIMPDSNAIEFISNYTFDNVKNMTDDVAEQLRGVLQRGFMDGRSPEQMKKDITKVFDVGKNRVAMIARTESNRAANFGRLQGYKDSGVKGTKVYVAKIDDRTSPVCKRMNGQEVALDAEFKDPKGEWSGQVPPAHVNCRSTWIFKIAEKQ